MGKRITNAFARDKGQASAGSQDQDDDPNKPPEPYICTGHFQADFTELCKRAQMAVVPPVVPKPQRPISPPPAPVEETKTKPGKGGDKKKQVEAPPPEPEPEPNDDPNAEPPEPPPKTYITKEKFEYFKPCVQVEMDNQDKQDTVTEVHIRGWKIDTQMMDIFKECWTKMERLHTINLWRTGLTDETIELLAQFLPECNNLKNLILDNNPVKGENYHLFLKEESPVQNLSLRYNSITDKGAESIGKMLGTIHQQNTKLISINLNGNRITDKGAEHLANGLRMNRNLLVLGLASNEISDFGAKKLAEVISRFPLTHEEIVERRKLNSEKCHSDAKSVSPVVLIPSAHTTTPTKGQKKDKKHKKDEQLQDDESPESPTPGSRRGDRDRPGSTKSAGGKGGKSAKNKKADTKGKEEEKPSKTKIKEDTKGAKKGQAASKDGSMANEKGGGKKGQTKGKGKTASNAEIEEPPSDSAELANPLLDEVEHLKDGSVVLAGNRVLISLNLSNNKIGEEGIKALSLAISYQTTLVQFSGSKNGTGLMRLCVNRNKVSKGNDILEKLTAAMISKDPYHKPPSSTDNESQISK